MQTCSQVPLSHEGRTGARTSVIGAHRFHCRRQKVLLTGALPSTSHMEKHMNDAATLSSPDNTFSAIRKVSIGLTFNLLRRWSPSLELVSLLHNLLRFFSLPSKLMNNMSVTTTVARLGRVLRRTLVDLLALPHRL